jgi:hypothetical protein
MADKPAELARIKGSRLSGFSFAVVAGSAMLLFMVFASVIVRLIFHSVTSGIVSGALGAIILFVSLWRWRVLGEAEMMRRVDKAIQPTNDPNEMARWAP